MLFFIAAFKIEKILATQKRALCQSPAKGVSAIESASRIKRRENMRQKYFISQEGVKNELKIREYTIR
jgi:hypothetical protein